MRTKVIRAASILCVQPFPLGRDAANCSAWRQIKSGAERRRARARSHTQQYILTSTWERAQLGCFSEAASAPSRQRKILTSHAQGYYIVVKISLLMLLFY